MAHRVLAGFRKKANKSNTAKKTKASKHSNMLTSREHVIVTSEDVMLSLESSLSSSGSSGSSCPGIINRVYSINFGRICLCAYRIAEVFTSCILFCERYGQ